MGALLEPFVYVLSLIVDVYFKIVVVQVVISWLLQLKVLETSNKYTQKTVEILDKLTVPVYRKIGQRIPSIAGLDFSPYILVLVLILADRLLMRLSALLV